MLKQFSNSAIQLFERCPCAFSFQYLDKISVVTAPALNRGSSLHLILERYDGTETKNSVVDKFLESEVGQEVKNILTSGNCLRETRLGCTPDLLPDTFGKGFFRGIIDLLYVKDGLWTVVDYKSGKFRDQPFDQLKIYAGLVALHHSDLCTKLNIPDDIPEVLELKYKFLDAQKELKMLVSREECLELLKTKIQEAKNILMQVDFPRNRGNHCWWCSYKDFCKNP